MLLRKLDRIQRDIDNKAFPFPHPHPPPPPPPSAKQQVQGVGGGKTNVIAPGSSEEHVVPGARILRRGAAERRGRCPCPYRGAAGGGGEALARSGRRGSHSHAALPPPAGEGRGDGRCRSGARGARRGHPSAGGTKGPGPLRRRRGAPVCSMCVCVCVCVRVCARVSLRGRDRAVRALRRQCRAEPPELAVLQAGIGASRRAA